MTAADLTEIPPVGPRPAVAFQVVDVPGRLEREGDELVEGSEGVGHAGAVRTPDVAVAAVRLDAPPHPAHRGALQRGIHVDLLGDDLGRTAEAVVGNDAAIDAQAAEDLVAVVRAEMRAELLPNLRHGGEVARRAVRPPKCQGFVDAIAGSDGDDVTANQPRNGSQWYRLKLGQPER